MSTAPVLTRVVLRNFRSIASCDVELGRLTFLVGLNGAGKSNFIDALRLCRDALRNPLEQAFASRASNLQTITHRNPEGQLGFGLRVEIYSPFIGSAHYAFWIGPQNPRGFEVTHEECAIGEVRAELLSGLISPRLKPFSYFRVRQGIVTEVSESKPIPISFDPGIGSDRLYLPTASAVQPFREVYEALVNMDFYDPDPKPMKLDFEVPGAADVLYPNGSNLPSVFDRISVEDSDRASRIVSYMQRIVPGVRCVTAETFKTHKIYKVLNFEQESGTSGVRTFLASDMSDGTLRALAVLVLLFQRSGSQSRPSVIGIEEPETGLHPAAAGILFDALREGQEFGQIIVSSHSPDLLDNSEVANESILAVDASAGATEIAPLDDVGRSSLQDRLYTAGELLRMDQLKPRHDPHDSRETVELFTAR